MSALQKDILNSSRVPDIKEAYNNLHTSLGDDIFKQYTGLIKQYFSAKISKLKFDEDARKLLSLDQIHLHNLFLLALSKGTTSRVESLDCLTPNSLNNCFDSSSNSVRYASQELCLPNEDLIRGRICVTALEHGLDGAEDGVTDMVVQAVKSFMKNIMTAMISQTNGYKIRENNFQHGIGIPVANPWLRNTSNIIDVTQESNITVNEDEQTFEPVPRHTLETSQQQTAFAYSCSTTTQNTNKLTLKCLYETLLQNPHVINNNSIYSVNLERILSLLDSS